MDEHGVVYGLSLFAIDIGQTMTKLTENVFALFASWASRQPSRQWQTGRRRFSAKVDIGDFVLGGIEDSSRGNVVTPQFLMKAQNVKLPKSPLRPLL